MAEAGIAVQPIAGALGAEIVGVDLSRELSNQAFDAIHRAFLDHLVVLFRGQTLTPRQQLGFARRFGPPAIYPYIAGLPDAPEVIEILKTEADTENFGGAWHSDTTYLETPAQATLLYAHEVPTAGGDTLYTNMYRAYETLSDGMKDLLDGLVAVNSSAQSYRGGRARKMKRLQGMKGGYVEGSEVSVAEHPVLRTHPDTGRKALYVNGSHTVRFRDMTEEESRPLLSYLCAHAVRPEFTCRVRWAPGTLVVWDNRCTQHLAVNDYPGRRRRMHRVTVTGDRPL